MEHGLHVYSRFQRITGVFFKSPSFSSTSDALKNQKEISKGCLLGRYFHYLTTQNTKLFFKENSGIHDELQPEFGMNIRYEWRIYHA